MKKTNKYKVVIAIVVVLLIIDQALKIFANVNMHDQNKILIDGVMNFTFFKNTGGFMGKPANMATLIVTDFVIIALILRFIIIQIEQMNNITKISLSMVLAGGISNLIDRIFLRGIIDYISLNGVYANLSDVYEILGFVLFALSLAIFTYKEMKNKKNRKKEG